MDGGSDSPSKSAAVYDIAENSWRALPDMPEYGSAVSVARLYDLILITS